LEVTTTSITGVLLFKPKTFRDARGYFVETWQKQRYEEAGINLPFIQDNHSSSCKDVLRGIHFQKEHPQGKLISVSLGAVFDVAVDLRQDSPTFGQWYGAELSEENQHQLWIPPGLGHAFLVLSGTAHFHYKCTDYYHAGDEGVIIWNDPDLNITWPSFDPLLSAKDTVAPTLREVFPERAVSHA
jgi:dTDP-4-dehydrorhamnose 3,5-epimerase